MRPSSLYDELESICLEFYDINELRVVCNEKLHVYLSQEPHLYNTLLCANTVVRG